MPHHQPVKYLELKCHLNSERIPRGLPHGWNFQTFVLNGQPREVRFICPCGCGRCIALPLVCPGRKRPCQHPVWDYRAGGNLINPSIRDIGGCKAHFFIKEDGTVQWCDDSGK